MATAWRNRVTAVALSFLAIAILAPSTSSAIFMMSLALLLMGMAKITSGGVFCSATATILYSASASLILPVPASAIPRPNCQKTVAVFMAGSGYGMARTSFHLWKRTFTAMGMVMKPYSGGIFFTCGPTLATNKSAFFIASA